MHRPKAIYKALILDDNKDQAELLEFYLKKYCKSISVIYTSTSIEKAINTYFEHSPEILFLDIELSGGKTGFNFLERIGVHESEIIFVTSYDQFAIKAIDLQAKGYVLKPIQTDKLVAAVNRVISNLEVKESLVPNKESLNEIDLIAVPSLDKVHIINKKDIIYLEADGRYTVFNLSDGSKKIASRNLGEYEKQLEIKNFFRIHHSYMVNLNMVVNIDKSAGNYCEMTTGKMLPISKRKHEKLSKFLNLK